MIYRSILLTVLNTPYNTNLHCQNTQESTQDKMAGYHQVHFFMKDVCKEQRQGERPQWGPFEHFVYSRISSPFVLKGFLCVLFSKQECYIIHTLTTNLQQEHCINVLHTHVCHKLTTRTLYYACIYHKLATGTLLYTFTTNLQQEQCMINMFSLNLQQEHYYTHLPQTCNKKTIFFKFFFLHVDHIFARSTLCYTHLYHKYALKVKLVLSMYASTKIAKNSSKLLQQKLTLKDQQAPSQSCHLITPVSASFSHILHAHFPHAYSLNSSLSVPLI